MNKENTCEEEAILELFKNSKITEDLISVSKLELLALQISEKRKEILIEKRERLLVDISMTAIFIIAILLWVIYVILTK